MSAELVQPETRRAWRDPLSMVLAVVLCLPALVPLLVIAHATISPEAEVWAHLSRYVLPEVTINTIKLLIGVALLSGVVGTALAWLTSICEFPGRRFFDWALLLPLAIPTYVLAFVAVGFLDFSGPLQSWLRAWTGTSAWVPKIRSTGGVIVVLSLALYPYVYLLARTAFLTQGRRALEAAQMLGHRPRGGDMESGSADGASLDRGRHRVDVHGNIGRLRRRLGVQLQHVHDRHLSRMVRHVLGERGAGACRCAAVVCDRGVRARAQFTSGCAFREQPRYDA